MLIGFMWESCGETVVCECMCVWLCVYVCVRGGRGFTREEGHQKEDARSLGFDTLRGSFKITSRNVYRASRRLDTSHLNLTQTHTDAVLKLLAE